MAPLIHHITLTVRNIQESLTWYQSLFGSANIVNRDGPSWKRLRANWPSGLILGFTEHEGSDSSMYFNHETIGLDHIGLSCADKNEVLTWKARLEELGFEHGPFEEVSYGWAVTARDPSNIAVEFFAPKPTYFVS